MGQQAVQYTNIAMGIQFKYSYSTRMRHPIATRIAICIHSYCTEYIIATRLKAGFS